MFAAVLRLLQIVTGTAIVVAAAGLVGIFIASETTAPVVKVLLGLGLVTAIVASTWLSLLRCPHCGKRFCGSQSGGDETPYPSIFSSRCRYCGQAPQV